MTPQELKNSILQLAIQGKLVEQRPEEGTAQELYQKMQKYHKGVKPCKAELNFSAMDFELPETWKMVELNQLFNFIDYRGKTPVKSTEGVSLITASNIRQGYMDYTRKEYISSEEYTTRKSRGITHKGDLLFTTEAPMGNVAICDLYECSCGQRIITFQEYEENTVIPKLFMYFILSTYFQKQLLDNCTGTTAKGIKADKLKHLLLPLPPLAEQKRIVAKIEELLPYIDRYEQAWSKLEQLNSRFPEDMKKALLQYAIQGKLVEQRPEEGTGEELFAQIQAEKQRLIQAGKIKKEKPLPEITEDEVPFEIPEGWKWVRIGSVCINIQYGSSQKSDTVGKMVVLRMGNIQDGKLVLDKLVYTSNEEEIRKYSLKYNDLLFNRTNSKDLVGKTAIYKGQIPAIYAGYLVRITPIYVDSDFLNYTMQSQYYWSYCQSVRSDAIGQSNINAEKLKRFAFPLPSLTEQKRIVEKLEQLLPLCDRLKKQIV